MSVDDQQLGRLIGHLEALTPTITEIKCDVKKVLEAQAATEERLKAGNARFEKIDCCLKEMDEKIDSEVKSIWGSLRKKADWRIVYPLVVTGFVVIVFLIDHFYNKGVTP